MTGAIRVMIEQGKRKAVQQSFVQFASVMP